MLPLASGALPARNVTIGENGIGIATAGAFTNPRPAAYLCRLSVNPGTGAITGFINHDASTWRLATPQRDGEDGRGGSAWQTFTIAATNQAPLLGLPMPG